MDRTAFDQSPFTIARLVRHLRGRIKKEQSRDRAFRFGLAHFNAARKKRSGRRKHLRLALRWFRRFERLDKDLKKR